VLCARNWDMGCSCARNSSVSSYSQSVRPDSAPSITGLIGGRPTWRGDNEAADLRRPIAVREEGGGGKRASNTARTPKQPPPLLPVPSRHLLSLRSTSTFTLTMSIDLDWSKLDASLATKLVDALNRTIANLTRPSFIGPVAVTALEFGTVAPDIEIIDIRDIYRDFTEDDDDQSDQPADADDEDEDFEWVSRRAAAKAPPAAFTPLPPHLRYGLSPGLGPSMDFHNFFNGASSMHGIYSPTSADVWRHMQYQQVLADRAAAASVTKTPSPPESSDDGRSRTRHLPASDDGQGDDPAPIPPVDGQPPKEAPSQNPDLQLHLYIRHESDMRITVTTSLLINYPSPMFMALPIKLSVTGLIFQGQVVVAYEGSRKRIHICIVDELDPYGPAQDTRRMSPSGQKDAETENEERSTKPLPIGQRLLPSIFIESEIGHVDKHVLRNVTRVERFMQEVIRKTVEDEFVFPNFHTMVMDDGGNAT